MLSKPRYLLLALVLWLGQAVLLVHATDLDAHSASADSCEICVHGSPVSSALPSAGLPLLPPHADVAPERIVYRGLAAKPAVATLARGPPAFS